MNSLLNSINHLRFRHYNDQSLSTNPTYNTTQTIDPQTSNIQKQKTIPQILKPQQSTISNTQLNSTQDKTNTTIITQPENPTPSPKIQPQTKKQQQATKNNIQQKKPQAKQENRWYTVQELKYSDDLPPVDQYFAEKNIGWRIGNEDGVVEMKHFPWGWLLLGVGIFIIVVLIIYAIYKLYKKHQTKIRYNQTPQNFKQKPKLSLNQQHSLLTSQFQLVATQPQLVDVKQVKSYDGSVYQFNFKNQKSQKSALVYWNKIQHTDCYFQIQIDQLNSEVQFGFIHKNNIKLFKDQWQKHIGKIGVSLNSLGSLKMYGEIKYDFRWKLNFGDVIGMGISRVQGNKRVWVTKNGILLNPPSSQQIQKWMNQQNLSNDHKQAFNQIQKQMRNSMLVNSNTFKKKDEQLIKKKIILPQRQKFQYYAIINSQQIINEQQENKILRNTNRAKQTRIKFNVGGRVFRLRDANLKTGLLADTYQKQHCCGMPCC